jgi:S-adenosylmethionine synthetase
MGRIIDSWSTRVPGDLLTVWSSCWNKWDLFVYQRVLEHERLGSRGGDGIIFALATPWLLPMTINIAHVCANYAVMRFQNQLEILVYSRKGIVYILYSGRSNANKELQARHN